MISGRSSIQASLYIVSLYIQAVAVSMSSPFFFEVSGQVLINRRRFYDSRLQLAVRRPSLPLPPHRNIIFKILPIVLCSALLPLVCWIKCFFIVIWKSKVWRTEEGIYCKCFQKNPVATFTRRTTLPAVNMCPRIKIYKELLCLKWMAWTQSVMGKHPDLMVGLPTSTVFPTNDRKFEISQFFRKKFKNI